MLDAALSGEVEPRRGESGQERIKGDAVDTASRGRSDQPRDADGKGAVAAGADAKGVRLAVIEENPIGAGPDARETGYARDELRVLVATSDVRPLGTGGQEQRWRPVSDGADAGGRGH
jgi:hypothetical protein